MSETPPVIVGYAAGADLEPEGRPAGWVEISFLVTAQNHFGAGLYEIRFLRPLTEAEHLNISPVLGPKPSAAATDPCPDCNGGASLIDGLACPTCGGTGRV